MHGGSWRADLHREGEDGQRTDKVRPALERLAADPDCNRDTCSAFLASECGGIAGPQTGQVLLFDSVCGSTGFLECLLLRTLRTFGCIWYRGCAVKTYRAHQ